MFIVSMISFAVITIIIVWIFSEFVAYISDIWQTKKLKRYRKKEIIKAFDKIGEIKAEHNSDELFEEKGYEKKCFDDGVVFRKTTSLPNGKTAYAYVTFEYYTKAFSYRTTSNLIDDIRIPIYLKMKELGWLDE